VILFVIIWGCDTGTGLTLASPNNIIRYRQPV